MCCGAMTSAVWRDVLIAASTWMKLTAIRSQREFMDDDPWITQSLEGQNHERRSIFTDRSEGETSA